MLWHLFARRCAHAIRWVRDAVGIGTYQLEYMFVLVVLLGVRYWSGGFSLAVWTTHEVWTLSALWHDTALRIWVADWAALFGVFFSFSYTSIADRLSEQEHARVSAGQLPGIACHGKLQTFFVWREIAWCLTFVLLQAWSALVGVFIFMAYPVWRRFWRRHFPVRHTDVDDGHTAAASL